MKKIVFYLVYLVSPIVIIIILYQTNPIKYNNIQLLGPMILGVLAYTWFNWQFVLSARPRFIDTLVGLDKIYRLHGMMAIVSLVLVFFHQLIFENLVGESMITLVGQVSFLVFLGVSILSVLFMTKARWMGLNILKPVVKLLEVFKVFKYEHYKLLHNLTIIGLIFMQVHVLLTSSSKGSALVFTTYMSYFVVSVSFYLYHKMFKPWILEENNCEVVDVRSEGESMWSIVFKPLGQEFKYKPGQFGFFKIFVDGHREEHPFSIASAPESNGLVSVTIKELGDFTSKMKKLRVGDQLIIDGPYGEFSYVKYPREKQFVFIVGGIGITPVMSMLRHLKMHQPHSDVLVLWGMRTIKDFIFKEEITDMLNAMPNLEVIPVVSHDVHYEGEHGFIDYIKLLNYLSKLKQSVKGTGFYICGPHMLMKNSIDNLIKMDIKAKQIHYESFSL